MVWKNKNMLSKRYIPEPPLNLGEVGEGEFGPSLELVRYPTFEWILCGIYSYPSNIPWIVTLNLIPSHININKRGKLVSFIRAHHFMSTEWESTQQKVFAHTHIYIEINMRRKKRKEKSLWFEISTCNPQSLKLCWNDDIVRGPCW